MNKQPEALRLAAVLDGGSNYSRTLSVMSAAELRRQHKLIGELVEALKHCADWFNAAGHYNTPAQLQANDAIANATKEQP